MIVVGISSGARVLVPVGALHQRLVPLYPHFHALKIDLVLIQRHFAAVVLLQRQLAGLQPTVLIPAAAVLLPVTRIAWPGLGLHVVPKHVFLTRLIGPQRLAGGGTRLTADALVEIDDHCDLGSHVTPSPFLNSSRPA